MLKFIFEYLNAICGYRKTFTVDLTQMEMLYFLLKRIEGILAMIMN